MTAKSLAEELNDRASAGRRLPDEYVNLHAGCSWTERIERGRGARSAAARSSVLGHHYQREDIIQFADFRGDSLKL